MASWCCLADGCDAADVARAALAENLVLAPGNVCSVAQSAAALMRFNMAQCPDPRVMSMLQQANGR